MCTRLGFNVTLELTGLAGWWFSLQVSDLDPIPYELV
jgi:hypothetical protein